MIENKFENITIRQWLAYLQAKEFSKNASLFTTVCNIGWYDWFCSNESLIKRTQKFSKILTRIENPILLDQYRIWFKNNCPMSGPLYDDIRFEPMDETLRDQWYFGIAIDSPHEDSKYTIFTARSGYENEFHFKNIHQVVKFLNSWNPNE